MLFRPLMYEKRHIATKKEKPNNECEAKYNKNVKNIREKIVRFVLINCPWQKRKYK